MIERHPSNYPLARPETISDESLNTLENALSSYLGYSHVIALDSVESAFSLSFSIFDEMSTVLCSPNAPLALFKALHKHCLQPRFCDLKLDGTLEGRFLHKNIDESSRALLVSHNHGQLAELDSLTEFADKNDLLFIEDATQAFRGKAYAGAKTALFDLETLLPSFIARGGFIATDDEELAAEFRLKSRGGYVQKKFWNYDIAGISEYSTMNNLTASFALAALSDIESVLAKIDAVQTLYLQKLASNRLVELPKAKNLVAYPLFPIALVPALFCPKEDIYQALTEKGIPVRVGNKPVYKTTAFKDDAISLFGAEEVHKAQILLPAHHLITLDEAASVVETLESVLDHYGYRGCTF
ncbi:DegT/DnrJ/EryC1/StrS family aminotransferase [Sulfurimonas sp. HSL3-7]|uniref:DegT/DnrJ/EryC1/StrS family aminotransferase n=1 Tax=Sulfonitrofixus jiaomeiensis TaxID=3131938 RepID=UPI0031F762B3